MNSNKNYSQFIEHSFRRLTLLVHEQNNIDTLTSTSDDKTTEQSFDESSIRNHQKSNTNKNQFESFSSRKQSHQRLINNNESMNTMVKVEPMFKNRRSFMRPPKNRTTNSYRCSSSQSNDRSELSSDQSGNTLHSLPVTKQKTYELPIHMPCERTVYDIRFERDRHNDIREKYNIPLPFERHWLRQPRYVPQERPIIGQTPQSNNP